MLLILCDLIYFSFMFKYFTSTIGSLFNNFNVTTGTSVIIKEKIQLQVVYFDMNFD